MEEITNPIWDYETMYLDTDGDNVYNAGRTGKSDIYKNMKADLVLMNAQNDIDEAWYQNHEAAPAKMRELRELGINPLSAARAVMGNLSQDSGSTSNPSVNSTGADGAAQQILDAMSAGVNSINTSIQTDLAMERQSAEIDHLNSESALNYANASEVAGLASSTNYKNISSGNLANSEVEQNLHENSMIDAQTRLIGEQYNLTVEETRQAKQIADDLPRMNQQQIDLMKSQTAEYWSQVAANYESVEKMKHEEQNIDASTAVLNQTSDNLREQGVGIAQENRSKSAQATHDEIVVGYEQLIGRPLNTNEKDVIIGYVEKGDYTRLNNFLQAAYDLSVHNNGVQTKVGIPSRAAGAYYSDRYKKGRTLYNP